MKPSHEERSGWHTAARRWFEALDHKAINVGGRPWVGQVVGIHGDLPHLWIQLGCIAEKVGARLARRDYAQVMQRLVGRPLRSPDNDSAPPIRDQQFQDVGSGTSADHLIVKAIEFGEGVVNGRVVVADDRRLPGFV